MITLDELRKPKELSQFRKGVAHINKVDTRDQSWQYSLPELMAAHGFNKLGSGKYASVYKNPKYPYVLKVFMKDAAYFKWLEFVLKNRNNPYVPRIKGKVVKINDMFYAVRMEPLKPAGVAYRADEFMQHFKKWERNTSHRSGDRDIDDILKYFSKHKKLLDLHGENVMMRGKQLVIIDPFYNWFGKHKPGEYSIDPDDVNKDIF